jgi:uncharacterized membrane protein
MLDTRLINPFSLLSSSERSPHRLEAFFDAIFAIAMTILVLSLALPQGHVPSSYMDLFSIMWAQLFHFALSFYILASFWRSHHRLFGAIKSLNEPVIRLNFVILFITCLLPFTTNLVGDYPKNIPAVSAFHINLLILGLLFWYHWRYAYNTKLISMEPVQYQISVQRHILVPASAIIALILVYFSPSFSSVAYLLIPFGGLILNHRILKNYPEITKSEVTEHAKTQEKVHQYPGEEHTIHLPISPHLSSLLDKAAKQTGKSKEEFTLQILSFWEKNNTMPLEGENCLCNLCPDPVKENLYDKSKHE